MKPYTLMSILPPTLGLTLRSIMPTRDCELWVAVFIASFVTATPTFTANSDWFDDIPSMPKLTSPLNMKISFNIIIGYPLCFFSSFSCEFRTDIWLHRSWYCCWLSARDFWVCIWDTLVKSDCPIDTRKLPKEFCSFSLSTSTRSNPNSVERRVNCFGGILSNRNILINSW